MKRTIGRVTALVVIVATLLGLTMVASADTEKKKLVCIGDSIAAGFGMLADYEGDEYQKSLLDGEMWTVIGKHLNEVIFYGYNRYLGGTNQTIATPTFSRQVADKLGYEYRDLTCSAVCLNDVYAMLNGDEYPQDSILIQGNMKKTMEKLKGLTDADKDTPAYQFYAKVMKEEIKNASVVVLSLGMNDITMNPMFSILYGDKSDAGRAFLKAAINGNKNVLEKLPKIVKMVQNINSDCEVIVTGFFNPLDNVKVTGLLSSVEAVDLSSFDKVGLESFTLMVDAMNATIATEVLACGATYVDVSGTKEYFDEAEVDVSGLMNGGSSWKVIGTVLSLKTHPDLDGHTYIAGQILKSMKTLLPQNGKMVTYFGDTYAGELIYRRTALGWTIQTKGGAFLNYDGEGKLTLSDRATVWKYDGGFYAYNLEESRILGFLGVRRTTKQYLTFDGKNFGLSGSKVKATLYKAD